LVIRTIVDLMKDPEKDPFRSISSRPRLILEKDIPWLLEEFKNVSSSQTQEILANLIFYFFNIENKEQVNAIISVCQEYAILKSVFSPLLEPIELQSDQARSMKEAFHIVQPEEEVPPPRAFSSGKDFSILTKM